MTLPEQIKRNKMNKIEKQNQTVQAVENSATAQNKNMENNTMKTNKNPDANAADSAEISEAKNKSGQSGREVRKMNTRATRVGTTKVKYWFKGIVPDSVEDAFYIGRKQYGEGARHVFYMLRNGDFCDITNGVGLLIPHHDFTLYLVVQECDYIIEDEPWEILGNIRQSQREKFSGSDFDYFISQMSDEFFTTTFPEFVAEMKERVFPTLTPAFFWVTGMYPEGWDKVAAIINGGGDSNIPHYDYLSKLVKRSAEMNSDEVKWW